MKKVICFGEALIDFLAQPGAAGAPCAFLQFAGGAPANVAVAAARLGARTEFIGMLGSDMFGDFLLESLRMAGVGTQYVVRTAAARTALAFVSLDAAGERRFSFYRPPAADLLFREADFHEGAFAEGSALHVCSNSLTEPQSAEATLGGMRRARDAGALVSVDLNLRPGLWSAGLDPTPRLWQMLEGADLVKLAHSELEFLAQPLGGEAAVLARLFAASARLVVVTHGGLPLRWHTRAGRGELPSFEVRPIDSTAAGDAFVGGLLSELAARGVDAAGFDAFLGELPALENALRVGAATGALAVTRKGAFEAMPSRAEVEQLLREQHGRAA
jgi:fructokinase